MVGLFESYVCKDGKRKVADREEKGGQRGGEKEGEEGIGDKVKEKDGGAFLKGESEKKGQDEDVECCPGPEGGAGGGGE